MHLSVDCPHISSLTPSTSSVHAPLIRGSPSQISCPIKSASSLQLPSLRSPPFHVPTPTKSVSISQVLSLHDYAPSHVSNPIVSTPQVPSILVPPTPLVIGTIPGAVSDYTVTSESSSSESRVRPTQIMMMSIGSRSLTGSPYSIPGRQSAALSVTTRS
jgi:hypothetical protein